MADETALGGAEAGSESDWDAELESAAEVQAAIRTDIPHSARMYDYYLGGRTNYRPDREAADEVATAFPSVFHTALENRDFMHRATRVLARNHGIRQWLDIGTGIPTSPNLHEVAQSVAADARVVYVDYDPIVLNYARALLRSTPTGRTAYVQADATDPGSILANQTLADTLDLSRPVALSLNALLHFIPDDRDPYGIVERLMSALPSGSALAISHCTPDFDPESWAEVISIYHKSGTPAQVRTRAEVERFFEGYDLIEPGIEVGHRWHPEETTRSELPRVSDADVSLWVGVAIKP
ncbi:SAM-dependent methyltransferase [Actinacidiphila bryophytorum]|uniref:SAM-dependent methyltransferase n=1 Tax=Actinacidiphila bryophytorum TaxID=1436133 RepID=UPI002176DD42|nr:SAM-dependent methyltransferase [Actinacidiphila bryophytorum]UWE10302.1 SAM-dependent methyltransferase [Actinacidiphila bryophytorum]